MSKRCGLLHAIFFLTAIIVSLTDARPFDLEDYDPIATNETSASDFDQHSIEQTAFVVEYSNLCAHRSDGNYALGCMSEYVKCIRKHMIIMNCGESLVFNEKLGQCIPSSAVNACSDSPYPPSTEAPSEVEHNNTVASEAPTVTETSTELPNSVCVHKISGTYANGCSSEFIVCVDGSATIMRCPATLVYDEKSHLCLEKKDVEVCGGHTTSLPVTESTTEVAQEETTASSTPQPTPLPEFSCHSLPDGIYAQHCSSVFIACSHGRSIPMHCPADLIFDPHLKVCQWKDKVLDCNEVEPTKETPLETTIAPEIVANVTDDNVTDEIASDIITETIPTTAPSGDSTFSCHGLPDGIYSQGCSKTFALCAAGIETSVKCPGRLFYDAQFEMCRVKAKIQECMNPATGDLPEPGNDDVTTEHPMLTMTDVIVNSDEPSLPTGETEISCVGRPDGMYALGCSTEFVACVAERVYRMVCPAGLKFEATAKKCLYERDVPACQGASTTPIPGNFSCSGYPDGMYAQGCSSDFTACVAGNPIAMKCPANLKYDQDEKKCLYEYQVSACQATPPTTEEPSSTDTMADFVTPITPSTLPIGASPCSALSEGIYGQGCSSNFVVCFKKRTLLLSCPHTLAFDAVTKRCLPQAYVLACTETKISIVDALRNETEFDQLTSASTSMPEASEEVSTIALEPTHPMLIKPSSTPSTISHMPMFAAPQELCINEPTGLFSFGCSSFYAVCSYGRAHLELCEGNLRFDIESGVCVEEVFVAACGEHLTTEPTTLTTPTTVSSDATSPCPGCPPCIVCPTCAPCPPCECDTTTPEATPSSPVTPQTPAPDDTTTPELVNTPPDCTGRDGSFYDLGCSSEFFKCSGGEAILEKCPSFMRFDIISSQCLTEEYVYACGGHILPPQSSTTTMATTTAAASEPEHESHEPKIIVIVEKVLPKKGEPTKPPKLVFPCEGLRNGYYALGCSSEFAYCMNGKTEFEHCPDGLKFDPDRKQCLKTAHVKLCQGFTSVERKNSVGSGLY